MSLLRKRELYVAVTLVTGVLTITDFFLIDAMLNQIVQTLINWTVLLTYFAIVLGLVNLFSLNMKRIVRRQPDMIFSAWLLLVVIGVTFIGIFLGTNHIVYMFLFTNVYGVLGPAGYGIMTFFVASSAFRVLRVRTFESLVLIICLIFTMFYRAPIGALIPYVPAIGSWIESVLSAAGMRGIVIGFAIGALGMGLRTLLGKERGYLSE